MFATDEYAVARFVREAKLAAAVNHTNVVDIYDVGNDAGGFYIVMEFLSGESLAERLERLGPMSHMEFESTLAGVVSGLSAAHAAGIVHRDLKPENIFLAEARDDSQRIVPKIVDFGISKALDPTQSSARLTGSNLTMGTPAYMSPEQIRSAADADLRTDIYALGVIAYQALSGTLPFDGDTAAGIILRVAMEDAAPLQTLVPGLPQHVYSAIERAMKKTPEERYDSVREFFDAFSGADSRLASQPLSGVRAATTAQTAARPRPTKQFVVALLAAVVVLGLVAFGATRMLSAPRVATDVQVGIPTVAPVTASAPDLPTRPEGVVAAGRLPEPARPDEAQPPPNESETGATNAEPTEDVEMVSATSTGTGRPTSRPGTTRGRRAGTAVGSATPSNAVAAPLPPPGMSSAAPSTMQTVGRLGTTLSSEGL